MMSRTLLAFLLLAPSIAMGQTPADSSEALFRKGMHAYNAGGYGQAVKLFSSAIEQDPENLNAYLQRGFCHSLLRDYQEAVADFTAVTIRKQDHLWAYISRGSAYEKWGKPELAIRDFNKALELDPRNQEAYNNRGWSKKSMGDAEGACQDWKASRKLGNAEAKIILQNNRCK